MEKKGKVLVVGGGMAGLITAAGLAQRGIDVQLIEKNNECGGLVSSFIREGFLFDAGIRAIENAGMIKPMLEELGIEQDVIHVENDASLKDYEKQLKRMYPGSLDDVDRIINVI